MKRLVFTAFFAYILLSLIIPNVFAEFSIGVQPSIISLSLSPQHDQITLPYRLWNQGNDTITIKIIPMNLTQFTNFSEMNVTLNAHTNRTEGYVTIPVVFRKTSGNITTEGGLLIRPIPPNDGMVRLIPEIFARVLINQTDKNTSSPAYTFPTTNVTANVTGSNTTTGSSQSSESTQNFFIQNLKAVGIAVVVLIIIVGMILSYKYLIQGI